MKLAVLFLCAGLTAPIVPVEGQNADGIRTDSVRVVASGASVGIRFRMEVPRSCIRSNYTLRYTPVLFGGGREEKLLPIAFTGGRKRLSDRRKSVVDGVALPAELEGHAGTVVYETSVPYARWMSEGPLGLSVDRRLEGYSSRRELDGFELLEDIRIRHPWSIYTPALAVADTASLVGSGLLMARARRCANDGRYAEAVEMLAPLAGDADADALTGVWRMAQDSAVRTALFPLIGLEAEGGRYALHLPAVSKAEVRSRTADTLRAGVRFGVKGTRLDVLPDTVSAALDRMAVLIAEHAAAGGPLPEIVVCGVSSPEGSSGRNGRLASERAAYVLSCLREACLRRGVSLADSLVRVEIRASDWSGLRALVEASDDMKYRRQTMELLDTTPAEKRMDALWGLKWGVPYTYVQRYLLPRLRSASIVVSGGGAALGDDAEEAIAAAVRKIAAGDYAGALSLLEPWAGDPRAALPLAVSRALTGDADAAVRYVEGSGR